MAVIGMAKGQIQVDDLARWANEILVRAGVSHEAAEATVASLIDADKRGFETHGVAMLDFYLPRLRSGGTAGAASPEVVTSLPAFELIDGHNALGAYVARFAMGRCCDLARTAGAAVVAVRNSSHFGAASCYSELAARQGCIGIALSNSDPGMALVGTRGGPVLGTNPMAIAAPFVPGVGTPSLDMATSVVAQGRLRLAARNGQPIPDDWAIAPDGTPTNDPEEGIRGGVLPMAGYKGFGLAFMIDVLTACLSGALLSPEIDGEMGSPDPEGTGHCFIAIDLGSTQTSGYEDSLRRLADFVHSTPRATGTSPFLIPGEREARTAEERGPGVTFTDATAALLRRIGDEYGVPFLW